MAPQRTWVDYALRIRSRKLRDQLQKIANQQRRSLNEIINIACEEYVNRLATVALTELKGDE